MKKREIFFLTLGICFSSHSVVSAQKERTASGQESSEKSKTSSKKANFVRKTKNSF